MCIEKTGGVQQEQLKDIDELLDVSELIKVSLEKCYVGKKFIKKKVNIDL